MPMTQAKLTIFFSSVGGRGVPPCGWTETFYRADTEYKSALGIAESYAKVRKELLGKGAKIIGVRISDAIIKRDTLISQLTESGGSSTIYTQDSDWHDPAQVDLLVRLEGGELRRRSFWMGGLADSVTDQLKEQGLSAAFLNGPPFKKWLNTLLDLNLCIRYSNKDDPRTYSLQAVTAAIPRMVRNRKRGRPFDLFRGLRN